MDFDLDGGSKIDLTKILTSAVIIALGLGLHSSRFSIIEVGITNEPELKPTLESLVVVVSILCILVNNRPYWPNAAASRPPAFVLFFMELPLILYVTEFLLRNVWSHVVAVINYICQRLSDYLAVKWIRNEGAPVARILVALTIFICMTVLVGVIDMIFQYKSPLISETSLIDKDDDGDSYKRSCNEFTFKPPSTTDPLSELPSVPPKNLLEIRRRVIARAQMDGNTTHRRTERRRRRSVDHE